MEKIITKNNLLRLLDNLGKSNKIIAPVKAERDIVFDFAENPGDIILDFTNSVKPPKEFFFSQTEEILEFSKNKIKASLKQEKRVLFGIRPCDLKGLCVMDPTFKEGIEDPHYLEKRKNTIIIVLACTKLCTEDAFCESANAGPIADGCFDIQLIELTKNEYLAEAGSKIGENIIMGNGPLFNELNKKPTISKLKFKNRVDLDKFYEKLGKKKFDDEKYWAKASKTCIRCAACNYLCPSCFCTNMADTAKARIRCWDSCMLRGFTREAAGVIPRESLSSRFRQRIFHKYRWHKERYGVHMCTGCGRCITYCPGLIPYADIINEVSGE